jgi:hypothetical protein
LRCDDERDHHLHAVRPPIARVAIAAFARLAKRRIDLKVRARQVVEQHVEARVEQIPPARRQMIEQRCFVLEQPIVAVVKHVNIDDVIRAPRRPPKLPQLWPPEIPPLMT